MSYYECAWCGADWCNFPQVFVMVNSKVENHDNKFENKFGEFVKEVAKEKGISIEHLYRVSGNSGFLSEVYRRYYLWLCETQKSYFCSTDCARKYLKIKQDKFDGKKQAPDYYGRPITIGDKVWSGDSDDWDVKVNVLDIIELYGDYVLITDHANIHSKKVKLED